MLFGRGRAIEAYLGVLAAIGVAILWAALLSPYSRSVAEGMAFGFGLTLIGGTALLMHRLIVPYAEE
jgi:hypothetical protein